MYKILLFIITMFALQAQAASLAGYSYSEMYMYDNQDDCLASEETSIKPLISDPFAPINKHIFNINSLLDSAFIAPAAEVYIWAIPRRGRTYVGNFISNMGEPINFANLLLQGQFKEARVSLGRFITNSLLGFFGIMDVATQYKLEYKGEDFGQTLAYYGMPDGPYVVLPLFGPSSVRDSTGKIADFFIDPFKYVLVKEERLAISATTALDKRSEANQVVKTVKHSLDPYETAKMLYIQNRTNQINNIK